MAVSTCVALGACACGPEKSEESTSTTAKPSRSSGSVRPEEPSASPRTEKPSAEPPGDQSAPRTKEGAIQRYEQYLHAVGREDINTVCEVAGPAAKQAEDQGFGPCTSTFVVTFQMISPAQKKALRTATVDPQRVDVLTPAKVEIPAEAIKASVTFSDSELGSSTLEYQKSNWYITD
ncbi:hypothetical protein [Streptomyces sp. NBC_01013]|uniref:hypothetical protein n=1 Tax=Streptomyces sp. NBC_01013 TaxID=2903718 RepID=UPI00386F013D|nr:hypothetical protein OG538_00590 [Streptomyces sp. NBC_01013]